MKNYRNIAVIPARGGSKRFPGKNLADLGGKPLIVHSIEYALANKNLLDKVVVSTDSEEIKNIALKAGAEVIKRPKEYSHDHSPTWEAVKHVLQETGGNPDHVFVVQPTNPLRPEKLLKKAYEKFLSSGKECLFSVSRSELKLGKVTDDSFKTLNYEFGKRSQDMESLYYENGLIYIAKTELVLRKNCLINEENTIYETDHPYSRIDIDTGADLEYARFLLNYMG